MLIQNQSQGTVVSTIRRIFLVSICIIYSEAFVMSIIFKAICFIHPWHGSLERALPYNSTKLTTNFHINTDYLVLEKFFPINVKRLD